MRFLVIRHRDGIRSAKTGLTSRRTMPATLEHRFRAIAERTPVRRMGVAVLASMTLGYLALITPELLDAPSRRVRIALALAWCLGAVALVMLARLWRHIGQGQRRE
jgi:hypothetical protein